MSVSFKNDKSGKKHRAFRENKCKFFQRYQGNKNGLKKDRSRQNQSKIHRSCGPSRLLASVAFNRKMTDSRKADY